MRLFQAGCGCRVYGADNTSIANDLGRVTDNVALEAYIDCYEGCRVATETLVTILAAISGKRDLSTAGTDALLLRQHHRNPDSK